MTHPDPRFLNNTNPHQRVDKHMQKPSEPNNRNTQPPPRVIPPQRPPIFMEEAYPKMKESVFSRVGEKINNGIDTLQAP